MQYPWPYPYLTHQPPPRTAPTFPLPQAQPHMPAMISHMPATMPQFAQPRWPPTAHFQALPPPLPRAPHLHPTVPLPYTLPPQESMPPSSPATAPPQPAPATQPSPQPIPQPTQAQWTPIKGFGNLSRLFSQAKYIRPQPQRLPTHLKLQQHHRLPLLWPLAHNHLPPQRLQRRMATQQQPPNKHLQLSSLHQAHLHLPLQRLQFSQTTPTIHNLQLHHLPTQTFRHHNRHSHTNITAAGNTAAADDITGTTPGAGAHTATSEPHTNTIPRDITVHDPLQLPTILPTADHAAVPDNPSHYSPTMTHYSTTPFLTSHKPTIPTFLLSADPQHLGDLHSNSNNEHHNNSWSFGLTITQTNLTHPTNLNTLMLLAYFWTAASHTRTSPTIDNLPTSSGTTTNSHDIYQYHCITIPSLVQKASRRFPPPATRATSTSPELVHINASHTGPLGNVTNILQQGRFLPSTLHFPNNPTFFAQGVRITQQPQHDNAEHARILHNSWNLAKNTHSILVTILAWVLLQQHGAVCHAKARSWVIHPDNAIVKGLAWSLNATPPEA